MDPAVPGAPAPDLIVDDEPAVRESLVVSLEFEGYRVDEAADGAAVPAVPALVAARLPRGNAGDAEAGDGGRWFQRHRPGADAGAIPDPVRPDVEAVVMYSVR